MARYSLAPRLGASTLTIVLSLLVIAPLLALIWEALQPFIAGGAVMATLQQWLGHNAGDALSGTLRLAALTTLFSIVAGGVMALLAHIAPPRGLSVIEPLVLTSFLIPPYLTAVAWSMLAGSSGLWQQALGFGGINLATMLYTLPGMAAVMAMHLTPLVYVMVAGAFQGVDERLVDCAQAHGASRLRARWTAYRPTVLPALIGSGLLVFLAASEEFGVPKVLGNYAGVHVLSVAVEEAMAVWPINLPRASGIGLMLALLALVLWFMMRSVTKGESVNQHRHVRASHLWSGIPLLLFAVCAAGLPLASIIVTALLKAISSGVQYGNWTIAHFEHVLQPDGDGLQALATSAKLAVSVSVIGTVLALLMAWMLEGLRVRLANKLEVLGYLPQAIPGVVLATGLILFWNATWNPLPVYGHNAILIVAYLTLTFPYALRYATSGLAQAPKNLSHAAAVHGSRPLHTLRHVRLPLAWPFLLAGATVSFAFSMRELAASMLLQPPGTQVISTYVFEQFDQGNAGDGMSMAVVGVLSTVLLLGASRAFLSLKSQQS